MAGVFIGLGMFALKRGRGRGRAVRTARIGCIMGTFSGKLCGRGQKFGGWKIGTRRRNVSQPFGSLESRLLGR